MFNLRECLLNDKDAVNLVNSVANYENVIGIYENPMKFGFAVKHGDRKKIKDILNYVIGDYFQNSAKANWSILNCSND